MQKKVNKKAGKKFIVDSKRKKGEKGNKFMTNFLSLLKRNIIIYDGFINFRITDIIVRVCMFV